MKFASRQDAGCRLGKLLRERGIVADVVLGLPRGGVIVAAEVARALNLPLDVLVVRKIGHPLQREFAVGAIAEPDVVILDQASIAGFPVTHAELDKVIAEETAHLREYRLRFRHSDAPMLKGKTILLVDDGLATGATTEAAVLSAKQQKAHHVIVAAPIASTDAFEKIKRMADDILVLAVDPDFTAVGKYYDDFAQTSDQNVVTLLRERAA